MVEVNHLGIVFVVVPQDLLHEVLVGLVQLLAVPLDVQDCARLRFHFIYVHVVDACDGI
jgi:hypothetical protein